MDHDERGTSRWMARSQLWRDSLTFRAALLRPSIFATARPMVPRIDKVERSIASILTKSLNEEFLPVPPPPPLLYGPTLLAEESFTIVTPA
jgi:hypothetical protein